MGSPVEYGSALGVITPVVPFPSLSGDSIHSTCPVHQPEDRITCCLNSDAKVITLKGVGSESC